MPRFPLVEGGNLFRSPAPSPGEHEGAALAARRAGRSTRAGASGCSCAAQSSPHKAGNAAANPANARACHFIRREGTKPRTRGEVDARHPRGRDPQRADDLAAHRLRDRQEVLCTPQHPLTALLETFHPVGGMPLGMQQRQVEQRGDRGYVRRRRDAIRLVVQVESPDPRDGFQIVIEAGPPQPQQGDPAIEGRGPLPSPDRGDARTQRRAHRPRAGARDDLLIRGRAVDGRRAEAPPRNARPRSAGREPSSR